MWNRKWVLCLWLSQTHFFPWWPSCWKQDRLFQNFLLVIYSFGKYGQFKIFLLSHTVHNVYIVQSYSPVVNNPLYQLQGNNRIPMYFDRNWGIKCQNPVVATGEYLGENHKFRVWESRKSIFLHFPLDRTSWDKYMLNGMTTRKF